LKHKLGGFTGFIIGLLYTYIITGLMGTIVYGRMMFLEFFAVSLAVFGIIYLISLSRIMSWLCIILVFLGFLTTGILILTDKTAINIALDFLEGIYRLWYNITFNEEIIYAATSFDEISLVLITIAASVAVLLLFNRHNSFYILSVVIFALFPFSKFMSAVENRLLFTVFCILTVLSYFIKVYRQKAKLNLVPESFPLSSMILFAVPVVIIPVIAAALIPKSDYPIQWPWLDEKIDRAFRYFESRYTYLEMEEFSLSAVGFSNSNTRQLGGPANPSNIEVLRVKAKNRTYLRGAAYYWYKDSAWTRANTLAGNENNLDVDETRSGWEDIPVDDMFPNVSDDEKEFLQSLSNGALDMLLFSTNQIEVEIRNIVTNNVFIPLKPIMPVRLADGGVMPSYELDGGAIISENRLRRGDRYSLFYIQPMYGETLFKKALGYTDDLYARAFNILTLKQDLLTVRILQEQSKYNADITGLLSELDKLNKIIDKLSSLRRKSEQIHSIYTALPDNLPSRIGELARDITRDAKSNYEKVTAIEKYLRNNYTYTLSPENVPANRDFVDYFLFDGKEGYCTYYATAMAVMLRTLGIPTRYVEGYVLPPNQSSDGIYIVNNSNAHAWVEVYFEGFGWLMFEPTPAFAGTMDYKTVSSSLPEDLALPYLEMMERYRRSQSANLTLPSSPEPEEETRNDDNIILIVAIVGGIVLLFLAINLLAGLLFGIRILGKNKEKVILIRYNRMIHWLSLAGIRYKSGESPREFAGRVDNLYILSPTFQEITEIFMKVRYGCKSVSEEESETVKKTYNTLKKRILKDIGIRRYLPLRTVFFRI